MLLCATSVVRRRNALQEPKLIMLYDSTVILLRSIVQRLNTNGEPAWDDCLQAGNQCLFELHQMSASGSRTHEGKPNGKFHVINPAFERATRAIPDVKAMMRAIRLSDKAAAVESGRAALSEMNGTRTALLPLSTVDSHAESGEVVNGREEPASTVHRRKSRAVGSSRK